MNTAIKQFLAPHALELGAAAQVDTQRHWRLATDEERIAWLVLDQQDQDTNVLSQAVLEELDARLQAVAEEKPKALVIRSAKRSGFVAGADIAEFQNLVEQQIADQQLRAGHRVFDRLAQMPWPTIAVVHGFALGGGFELALACDYRIAIDGASFGFPEVQLGLHPGLGGTFRLTRLIDPIEAMTLMLTGKRAHTDKARSLGIVDLVTRERHVRNAVRATVAGEVSKKDSGFKASALSLQPARVLAASRMRSKTAQRAPAGHYPAPYALIDLWERHGDDGDAMQKAEIESFAKLLQSDTAQNLQRVYFLREKLRRASHHQNQQSDATTVRHLHVLGAGAMGAEIAAWCAIKNVTVTLADVEAEPIAAAMRRLDELASEQHLSSIARRDAFDRLIPDLSGTGVAAADLVLEALPEKPDLKRKAYAALRERIRPGAILASNTSSLPLADLARDWHEPSRFAGLHFFNPVSKMQLVEVVGHDDTDPQVLARLASFVRQIDRLPAQVASYPGFLVNRVLTPYLLEAVQLLEQGVSKERVDEVAESFGMPMGPVELADRVGLDICVHVADSLTDNLDKALAPVPPSLRDKLARGELGRKSGAGFYEWAGGKPKKGASKGSAAMPDSNGQNGKVGQANGGNADQEDLTDRLILPMLDAAVECLRCNVVADADTLDAALIFGTGFAPFRGGPVHYARQRGPDQIQQRLRRLADRHGPRFEPDAGWPEIA